MLKTSLLIILLGVSFNSCCQKKTSSWSVSDVNLKNSKEMNWQLNNFKNEKALYPFFEKLSKTKAGEKNTTIIHIGDSHLQADVFSNVVREAFQENFGNAGRGLTFPFQLAKTNSPVDIKSLSPNNWENNRVVKTSLYPACGISGFGIVTKDKNPELHLELKSTEGKTDTFDHLNLFTQGDINMLKINYEENEIVLKPTEDNICVDLKQPTSKIDFHFASNDSLAFYGVLLEKQSQKGVLYHTIGVNGAKYSDYNKTPLFWQQLKKVDSDCYIVSLGTNEAQDQKLNPVAFLKDVAFFVNQIKKINPLATIILTTPPVSYYHKKNPNLVLDKITEALLEFCKENNLVCWDLYNISGGSRGAKKWRNSQKLRQDLVHFSIEGYQLQGYFLAAAFSNAWNNWNK